MSVARFYAYRNVILIPVVAQAQEGFYLDVGPVTVCDTNDTEDMRAALKAAIESPNPIVPTPDPTEEPGSVILEELGLGKWLPFEAEAMMYTVHCNADRIECYSTGRAVKGTWQMQQSKHMSFERSDGLEKLINTIIFDIGKEREEALATEQANKAGGLALLPPPRAEGEQS